MNLGMKNIPLVSCLLCLNGRDAAEMRTTLAADESNVEIISIKNQTLPVAEEYQRIGYDQWLDAKIVLDKLGGDRTPDHVKIQLLFTSNVGELHKST